MSKETLGLTPQLQDYLVSKCFLPDPNLKELIKETAALEPDLSMMQIAPEQGAFMNLLVHLLQPKFCVEVGTFTGYSAICTAKALKSDARLLCCDISEQWSDMARRYFKLTGVSDKIQLVIAPALETLENLPPQQEIDFAFIDADKLNYLNYYEVIFSHLSPSGLILVDNVLWSGLVADPQAQDEHTQSIRDFNDYVAQDSRAKAMMLPLADGLLMITKAASA